MLVAKRRNSMKVHKDLKTNNASVFGIVNIMEKYK